MLVTIKGNGDVVIVSNEVRLPTWDLIVQPELKTYADLKGKVLGVSQIQSASTLHQDDLVHSQGAGQIHALPHPAGQLVWIMRRPDHTRAPRLFFHRYTPLPR